MITEPTPDKSRVDQAKFRGDYERVETDTARLARELWLPQDLHKVITDFEDGFTDLRDVGRMTAAQRDAILDAYRLGTIDRIMTSHPDILSIPVTNLHQRVTNGPQDQPIGHNFFVNADGFIQADLPWAKQLDSLVRSRTGSSIRDIGLSDDMAGKDNLLRAITEYPDDQLTIALAVYLAGRSLEGERYLEREYGAILQQSKVEAWRTIQTVAQATGLRIDMLERAARQLHLAAFGSFDHLEGLVTSDNTGTAGDYRIGTLRIEVQFVGSVRAAELPSQEDAHHVVVHEVEHATSAQSGLRCGLQASGMGLEANEGMTEYLGQLSIHSPNSVRQVLEIGTRVAYRPPTITMYLLHQQLITGENQAFATLFNAYHGDVRNKDQLEEALDTFYTSDNIVGYELRQ